MGIVDVRQPTLRWSMNHAVGWLTPNRSLVPPTRSKELGAFVQDQINCYNRVHRHSSLGAWPPWGSSGTSTVLALTFSCSPLMLISQFLPGPSLASTRSSVIVPGNGFHGRREGVDATR